MSLLDDLLARHERRLALLQTRDTIERWAAQVAAVSKPLVAVDFGAELRDRWQTHSPTQAWAEQHSQQFTVQPYGNPPSMEVSPYVPPLRQISSARQGAAEWGDAPSIPAKSQPVTDIDAMRRELEALGWKKSP